MVYYKRNSYRRRYGYRKMRRGYRKRYGRLSRMKMFPRAMVKTPMIHNFTRFVQYDTLEHKTLNTPTFASYTFTLADLPNFGEFTSLYDNYRINYIKVWLIPQANIGNLGSYDIGTVVTVIDYDDAMVPSTLDELYQFDTMKIHKWSSTVVRGFRPQPSIAAYTSSGPGFTAAAKPHLGVWIDMANANVDYFAFKIGITAPTTLSAFINYQVFAKFYFQCKALR